MSEPAAQRPCRSFRTLRPRTGGPDHDPTDDHSPSRWDSVTGVLLYPRRPNDPSRAQLVEELADREALMVVWYSETDWQQEDDLRSHDAG